jgi:hypothetical protein
MSFRATFVPAHFEDHVLAHDVPVVPQTLEERFDWCQERSAGARTHARSEDADARDAPHLLRLSTERRRESGNPTDDEGSPVHYSIT